MKERENSNNSRASYGLRSVCFCGEAAVMRTSWTEKNPGRRFHGCSLHQRC